MVPTLLVRLHVTRELNDARLFFPEQPICGIRYQTSVFQKFTIYFYFKRDATST